MVRMNGFTVKNIRSFAGMEFPTCYQANVYLENKKIAFWSQDSWGGPDRLDVMPYIDAKKLKNLFASYENGWETGGVETGSYYFVYNLVSATLRQRESRVQAEKGYPICIEKRCADYVGWFYVPDEGDELLRDLMHLSKEEILIKKYQEDLDKLRVPAYIQTLTGEDIKVSVSRYDSADIDVGAPASLADILR